MWVACTNRETIKIAAQNGIGALAFSFVDPDEASTWVDIYYDTIKNDQCVPVGHAVNANIAVVAGFSLHEDRLEAIRRGQPGFDFFGYTLGAMVTSDIVPGRTDFWSGSQAWREEHLKTVIGEAQAAGDEWSGCIGNPDDARRYLREVENSGVDQVIFLQQAGRNLHSDICSSLELFAAEVMPEFKAREAERALSKAEELEPYIEAAMARKKKMEPIADADIPVVPAAVARPQTSGRI